MLKACALAVLAVVLGGCALRTAAQKEEVEWPEPDATPLVMPSVEAGATLAAAAAVREMIRENPFPDLFRGCSSPEQGLDVATFKDPKSGLYYVVVHQHFSRCGGPRGRVLDWWYEYAVTPQGEVLGRAPPLPAEDAFAPSVLPSPPSPSEQTPLPEQTTPPPTTPSPGQPVDRPEQTSQPAPEPVPAALPPAEPSQASSP
jgi:hypothetical protein